MNQATQTPALAELRRAIQTAAFARRMGYQPASIRTAYWRNGHFNGIKPIKLPNGRLLWPADEVERLIAGEVAE